MRCKKVSAKSRSGRVAVRKTDHPRKAKFQADLAPPEDRAMRGLKAELHLTSNTDLLSDALMLFRWAVSERKMGNRIVREGLNGERRILVMPRLERVAPALSLPRVEIQWTERELASFAELASRREAARPTEALIRAMRD